MVNSKDDLLIVCPSEEKLKILDSINKDKLYNIKFMTKKEFLDSYYFKYDLKTIYYLINKYNYDIDVVKVYLDNLYFVDENKNYNNSKLNFLKELKRELIDNNLLIFNKAFRNSISKYDIVVKNYYDLDSYEEKVLNYKVNYKLNKFNSNVIECNTLEDEVNYVCLKIIDLLDKGIDINKIYLTNISDDYLYTIYKLFSYYNIPINIDFKNSIYSTKVVKDYLDNEIIDLDNSNKNIINKKLINVISELSFIDEKDPIYNKLLIDKLKHTYIPSTKYVDAVNIKNLYDEEFMDDEYVFVLGFNQDILPKIYKDIDYITDKDKKEIDLYDTAYLNKREKLLLSNILGNIKNLFLSYKLSSSFSTYYRSSLIDDLGLNIIKYNNDLYNKSNIYNEIRLGEKLDLYNLYGLKDDNLLKLNSHYNSLYNTYDNNYTNINKNTYLENLDYPLNLSYTSLNSYNECKFKYYIKYVLKLDDYEDTFGAFIGSLYHKILSLYKNSNFDLDKEYNNYLKTRYLSLKEKFLLIRLKKDLENIISKIKMQEEYTNYKEYYFEKKVSVKLDKDISVEFVGYIDKIMFYKNIEDVYFSIIDYKTGKIDTSILPMKHGLNMQLPVYLYLIHYSKIFKSPIFSGIYYQNILFDYLPWSKKLDKEKCDLYLLKGYSTDDIDILSKFDKTYKDSRLIKGMSYNDKFGRYSKVLDNNTLYNLVKFTKKHIDNKTDEILDRDFSINPKVYKEKNISCKYCKFKDLCYMNDKNIKYLEDVDDLSFLGGEA
ncbi:MAG: PD-(D/E)XK nuclease family protein [Bacilli bacterium]|nr:PD-(D/E)XK nuclease family protein [Bacilli bacterium]